MSNNLGPTFKMLTFKLSFPINRQLSFAIQSDYWYTCIISYKSILIRNGIDPQHVEYFSTCRVLQVRTENTDVIVI